MNKIPRKRLILLQIVTVYLLAHSVAHSTGADNLAVSFENKTEEAGLTKYTPTFSVVVSDIDNDGRDDLFIGHHGFPPMLYLKKNGRFTPQPEALPIKKRADRHGYTFVDFDNDGDKDFVVAGGGAEGIGVGMANEVYRNMLVESGRLEFIDVSSDSNIGNPPGRTRHLLPLSNPAGDKVDLYSTGLHERRVGSRNLFAVNHSTASNIIFKVDTESSLSLDIASDGKDLFFDFDRDGLTDFLSVGHGQALLYRNDSGKFIRHRSELDNVWQVISAAVADLNNDGFPDLFLGRGSGNTNSDHVESNSREIHFSVANQRPEPTGADELRSVIDKIRSVVSAAVADLKDGDFPDVFRSVGNGYGKSGPASSDSGEDHRPVAGQGWDEGEQLSFKTESPRLRFNFTEPLLGLNKQRTDATDIYIGQNKENPQNRTGGTGKLRAVGKPANTDRAGIYIWYEKQEELWHILWRHKQESLSASKGIIYADGIKIVEKQGLEKLEEIESQDYILLNRQGRGWDLVRLDELRHTSWTNHVTAADFNNDGFIDVVGVQTGEDGEINGDPFIVLNQGDLGFSRQVILQNKEDDIFRADLIVHGFFNNDGLPDLFFTNGYGLIPSHVGPYQLWLNTSKAVNNYLLLELEGSSSNRDAIGAQIELYDTEDKLLGYRELGSNFNRGQNSHKVHFGLGMAKGPFSLRIRWPGTRDWEKLAVSKTGFHHIKQPFRRREVTEFR